MPQNWKVGTNTWTKNTTPGGVVYWTNSDDPGWGYLNDPNDPDAQRARYPLTYIDYLNNQAIAQDEIANTPAREPETPQTREMTAAALEGVIRVAYGRVRVGGSITGWRTANGGIYTMMGLGHGPIAGDLGLRIFERNEALITVSPGLYRTARYGTNFQFYYRAGAASPAAPDAYMNAVQRNGPERYPYLAMISFFARLGEETGITDLPEPLLLLYGRTLRDPRLGQDASGVPNQPESADVDVVCNPALALADYYTSTIYGLGVPDAGIDWDSVAEVADYCDEVIHTDKVCGITLPPSTGNYLNSVGPLTVVFTASPTGDTATGEAIIDPDTGAIIDVAITHQGSGYVSAPTWYVSVTGNPSHSGTGGTVLGAKRHTLNLAVSTKRTHRATIETIKKQARIIVFRRDGKRVFRAEKAEATRAYTFTPDNSSPVGIEKVSPSAMPNMLRVAFVNPKKNYEFDHVWARTAAAEAGTEPPAIEEITLDGCDNAAEAQRQADFLLAEMRNPLSVSILANRGTALAVEVGDRVGYYSPSAGLGNSEADPEDLRVLVASKRPDGTNRFTCKLYNENAFSDETRPTEATISTPLTNPGDAPDAATAPSGAASLTEGDGLSTSGGRVEISWDHPGWPFTLRYKVTAQPASGTETVIAEVASGPVQFLAEGEQATYTFRVYAVVNATGATSAACAGTSDLAGAGGLSFGLTNEAVTLAADAAGTVSSFASAIGQVKVYSGANDVTADCTFGAVTASGCTGTVNTAVNTPVAGQPAGYYRVTAMSADSAYLDIPVTYMGSTVTLRFSLAKSRQGATGTAGANGMSFLLTNEAHVLAADSAGTVSSYAGASTTVKAYSGTTEVTPTIGTLAPSTGVTAGVVGAVVSVSAMSVDSGYVDIPVTYGAASVTLRFTVSKSRQGTTGANAKILTVSSDRQAIKYDTSDALNPASQTTTLTANKQNTTATVSWSATKLDGTAITPVTNLLSAATGDSVTMTAANFNTQRGSTEGVKITATLTDGVTLTDTVTVLKVRDGAQGATGATGANGINFLLTNEAHTVPADASGTVTSFSGAGGSVKVYSGGSEVAAGGFTIASSAQSGLTATVDNAAKTYAVTAMSADVGYLDMLVTYGSTSVTLRFTVSKSKAGSAGANAKTLTLISDRQIITFDELGALLPAQDITFTAQKQNMTTGLNWSLTRLDGTALTITTYVTFETDQGSYARAFMTAANFNSARGTTEGVILTASTPDGIADKISIVRVQKGAKGDPGDPADKIIATKDAMAGIGGRVLVGPTTKLAADFAAATTTITLDAAILTNGGIAVLQKVNGGVQQTEYVTVTSVVSGTGPYTYSVTRNADASGANDWVTGDTVVSLGITGSPFVDLYSVRGLKSATEVGPTMVGNIRTGAAWNAWEPRWAIGNLNGLFGYTTDIFGAAFGVPSGAWLKIDATNGIRIGHGATTKISLDASGNASFTGAVTATSGSFTGSITASSGSVGGWNIGASRLYSTDGTVEISPTRIAFGSTTPSYGSSSTEFYVDSSGRFSLGSKLLWDGTSLSIDSGSFTLNSSGLLASGSGVQLSSGGVEMVSGSYGLLINGSTGVALFDATRVEATKFTAGNPLFEESTLESNILKIANNSSSLSGTALTIDGDQVVGTRGAAVADATNSTDVVTQFNTLLARLRASTGHGMIAG